MCLCVCCSFLSPAFQSAGGGCLAVTLNSYLLSTFLLNSQYESHFILKIWLMYSRWILPLWFLPSIIPSIDLPINPSYPSMWRINWALLLSASHEASNLFCSPKYFVRFFDQLMLSFLLYHQGSNLEMLDAYMLLQSSMIRSHIVDVCGLHTLVFLVFFLAHRLILSNASLYIHIMK